MRTKFRRLSRRAPFAVGFGISVVLALPSAALATQLMVVMDNSTKTANFIDPSTDTVRASESVTGGAVGQCAIDSKHGQVFTTNFLSELPTFNVGSFPFAPSLKTTIPISNPGEDLALASGGNYLIAVDGSAVAPISVVATTSDKQVSTLSTGTDSDSVTVVKGTQVLVTSFNSNTLKRYVLFGSGLVKTSNSASVSLPVNTFAPPQGGFVLSLNQGDNTVRSFSVPSLKQVSVRTLPGLPISGVTNTNGKLLYIRTDTGLVAYAYNPTTGAIGGLVFSTTEPMTDAFFGMNLVSVSSDNPSSKVYVSALGVGVEVYNALTGTLIDTITDPNLVDPTGICGPATP